MAYRIAGERGPLVVFCHGFPELSYSWRHQLPALASAGYRAVAPDMRGYGDTGGPDAMDQYTLHQLVGDIVGLVHSLGETKAVIVGHDWGAGVAWHAALTRPDMFRAVCAMSVPFPPWKEGKRPTQIYREATAAKALGEFYIVTFQKEGEAEKEFERDVGRTLRAILGGIAEKDKQADRWLLYHTAGTPILDLRNPRPLPGWISDDEFRVFVEAFDATGFRRPLNWYRNIDRNWELGAPWSGAKISQPALFITGERDPVRDFTISAERAMKETVPGLRDLVVVSGGGHWIQQEKPEEVTSALLEFLQGL